MNSYWSELVTSLDQIKYHAEGNADSLRVVYDCQLDVSPVTILILILIPLTPKRLHIHHVHVKMTVKIKP